MLMVKVGYPTREEERAIMDRQTAVTSATVTPKVTPEQLIKARGMRILGAVYYANAAMVALSSASASTIRWPRRRKRACASPPTASATGRGREHNCR